VNVAPYGDKFKYTRLRDKLRKDILAGRYAPGDQLPSENELRIKFGLSNNTVREAMLSLVNEGLVCRTRGKGTFVADMRPSRKTLAVVIPRMGGDPLDHGYDVMPTYVAAIESEAHEMGWDLLLHVYNHDTSLERQRLLSTIDRGVDGVISFFSCCPDNNDCIREIEAAGIPVVMVDAYRDDLGVDYVGTDNFLGSYEATVELTKAGFERVCYFNSDHGDWNPITPRRLGYEAAMKESGRYPHVLYPIEGTEEDSINDWEERGYGMARQMLGYVQHPFAIFAVTPALAIGAWRAMSEANLPLDAVALGCFDNPRVVLPEELLAVTVVQPLERIGRKAVQVIIDNLNGTETRSRELIGPEIVVSKAVTSETKELAPVV